MNKKTARMLCIGAAAAAAAPLFLIAFVTGAILELTMETMGDDRSTVGTASFALGFVLMIVLKIVSDVTG